MTDREAISAQDIGFRDVAIDKNSEEEVASDAIIDFDDTFSERSRTTSDVGIEKGKDFDNVSDEKIIDRDDETGGFDSEADETTDC